MLFVCCSSPCQHFLILCRLQAVYSPSPLRAVQAQRPSSLWLCRRYLTEHRSAITFPDRSPVTDHRLRPSVVFGIEWRWHLGAERLAFLEQFRGQIGMLFRQIRSFPDIRFEVKKPSSFLVDTADSISPRCPSHIRQRRAFHAPISVLRECDSSRVFRPAQATPKKIPSPHSTAKAFSPPILDSHRSPLYLFSSERDG